MTALQHLRELLAKWRTESERRSKAAANIHYARSRREGYAESSRSLTACADELEAALQQQGEAVRGVDSVSEINTGLAESLERMAAECKNGDDSRFPETVVPGCVSGFFADDLQEAARIIRDHATLEEALANAVSEVDVLTGQLSTLQSAKRGWNSGISLSLKLYKVFFVWLPCIALFALPAYLVGYAWCWIVGGFRAGEIGFHNTKGTGVETWRMEIQVKEAGK